METLNRRDEKISSAAAYQHCLALRDAGMNSENISSRSGIDSSQVRRLLRGETLSMFRFTSEALLGVPIPRAGEFLNMHGLVDATGSRRRLQALAVQGFSARFLTKECGIVRVTLKGIRSGGKDQIRVSTLRIITALHDRFWDTDPVEVGIRSQAITLAKSQAAREKWWPTEAWADIDDPDCKPTLKTPQHVILAENCRELVNEQGYTMENAAARIGVSRNTLDKAVRYHEIWLDRKERGVS